MFEKMQKMFPVQRKSEPAALFLYNKGRLLAGTMKLDLRHWLDQIDSLGKLRIVKGVDWDQEIGAMVANNTIDCIIFFRDPLTAQPHEPDVSALLRLSDVYDVPLATNEGTAEAVLYHLSHKDRG